MGVVLLLLESLHGAFILSMIGAAALLTAALALLTTNALLLVGAFVLLSAAALWLLRPVVVRRLSRRDQAPDSNVAALIGADCRVEVAFDAEGVGRVRVGGETWRARLRSGADAPAAGAHLRIVGCTGTTLEVAPEVGAPKS